nr:putative ribonuclease H-like domain-containing protein [Tanacetum cinerariifolium]
MKNVNIAKTKEEDDEEKAMIVKELKELRRQNFITASFSHDSPDQEPKRVYQALKDPSWIEAMQEELLQLKMQKVWILVDLPYGKRAIGTKWEEGIDYEEVFAPVARIEAIRLFLAYASFMGFPVYQMDVKSAFLYGTIEEEVYVCQPPGFEDPEYPNKVYKVVKALYGLHQAPRAWYETLATYLLENRFQKGTIDQTWFIKKQQKNILLVQIYVDDIIFGATNKALCQSFEKLMKDKFQMSSMGELTFFLGLQDKYVAEILRKFGLSEGKSASTPIDAEKHLLKDLDGEDVNKKQKEKRIEEEQAAKAQYWNDDQSLSDEDVREKIYSNPLFDEEIIPMEIDQHSLNAESDLIESRQFRGIPGDLSPGIGFPDDMSPGIHRTEKLEWDTFPGDILGRQRRAHIVSVKQLSVTVEGFPRRHVAEETTIN